MHASAAAAAAESPKDLGKLLQRPACCVLLNCEFAANTAQPVSCLDLAASEAESGKQVFAWGGNNCGQLGLGDTNNRRAPTIVEGLWAMPVRGLATVHDSACCGKDVDSSLKGCLGRAQHADELCSFERGQ